MPNEYLLQQLAHLKSVKAYYQAPNEILKIIKDKAAAGIEAKQALIYTKQLLSSMCHLLSQINIQLKSYSGNMLLWHNESHSFMMHLEESSDYSIVFTYFTRAIYAIYNEVNIGVEFNGELSQEILQKKIVEPFQIAYVELIDIYRRFIEKYIHEPIKNDSTDFSAKNPAFAPAQIQDHLYRDIILELTKINFTFTKPELVQPTPQVQPVAIPAPAIDSPVANLPPPPPPPPMPKGELKMNAETAKRVGATGAGMNIAAMIESAAKKSGGNLMGGLTKAASIGSVKPAVSSDTQEGMNFAQLAAGKLGQLRKTSATRSETSVRKPEDGQPEWARRPILRKLTPPTDGEAASGHSTQPQSAGSFKFTLQSIDAKNVGVSPSEGTDTSGTSFPFGTRLRPIAKSTKDGVGTSTQTAGDTTNALPFAVKLRSAASHTSTSPSDGQSSTAATFSRANLRSVHRPDGQQGNSNATTGNTLTVPPWEHLRRKHGRATTLREDTETGGSPSKRSRTQADVGGANGHMPPQTPKGNTKRRTSIGKPEQPPRRSPRRHHGPGKY